MRTLVDLLHDTGGYVRIYADLAGFGYEKCSYSPLPVDDLFDRMGGYDSIVSAHEAAQLQLLALRPAKRRKKNTMDRISLQPVTAKSVTGSTRPTGP